MFEWLLGCVILTLKVAIGSFIITLGFWTVIGIIALIVAGIAAMVK